MELMELAIGILIGILICSLIPKIPIGINDMIRKRQEVRKVKKNDNESSGKGINESITK